MLASLNHPNVAAIYGFVERRRHDAPVYALALELVEGYTLAERIARGPIAVEEALAIARQIAEGLEAAHAHGVIHRDLKPANIKLRPDGGVKVLDFGLAKALDEGDGRTEATDASMTRMSSSAQLNPTGARFSPDGKWVVYAVEEGMIGDGTAIYVQPFPASGVRHRLHVPESRDLPNSTPHKPLWSPDGRELFYVPRLGGFEVVRVSTQPGFSFGPPMQVPRPFAPGAPRFRTLFDVMSDGRFVAMIPVGAPDDAATSGPGIQVVLDWFDELQEKVPT